MNRIFIAALCLALGACTSAIKLRNSTTGQTATCGPFMDTWTTPQREGQCIADYQRQGFERAPD